MPVTLYSSSDAGAPALRGNSPGDLINLLEKCLVSGYGSKAGAGWTMPYSGGNVAAFRQGAGSNGMYLRVDDSQEVASGARAARCVAYESMSSIGDGSPSPFPTEAQVPGGIYMTTSVPADFAGRNNARPWWLVADATGFWLYYRATTRAAATATWGFVLTGFGDFDAASASDSFNTALSGATTPTTDQSGSHPSPFTWSSATSLTSVSSANASFVARSYVGTGAPVAAAVFNETWIGSATSVFATAAGNSGYRPFVNPADGRATAGRIGIVETGSPAAVRGVLRGLRAFGAQPAGIAPGDTFTDNLTSPGLSYLACPAAAQTAYVQCSGDW